MTRIKQIASFLFVTQLSLGQTALASETFNSGVEKVAVVELYTSEGCSSCPPADRWLSKLKTDKQLFKSVIPLAFHVDYWNYLGWQDEFSDPKFSARQRQYQQLGHTQAVYTPGFVIDGAEWRGFFSLLGRDDPPIDAAQRPMVGELSLHGTDNQYVARFKPTRNEERDLVISLAYLGTDISTEVRRGENAGRTLKHDFVVLGMTQAKLDENGEAILPRAQLNRATAVAAWVSEQGNPAPVQAVGGWLN